MNFLYLYFLVYVFIECSQENYQIFEQHLSFQIINLDKNVLKGECLLNFLTARWYHKLCKSFTIMCRDILFWAHTLKAVKKGQKDWRYYTYFMLSFLAHFGSSHSLWPSWTEVFLVFLVNTKLEGEMICMQDTTFCCPPSPPLTPKKTSTPTSIDLRGTKTV